MDPGERAAGPREMSRELCQKPESVSRAIFGTPLDRVQERAFLGLVVLLIWISDFGSVCYG